MWADWYCYPSYMPVVLFSRSWIIHVSAWLLHAISIKHVALHCPVHNFHQVVDWASRFQCSATCLMELSHTMPPPALSSCAVFLRKTIYSPRLQKLSSKYKMSCQLQLKYLSLISLYGPETQWTGACIGTTEYCRFLICWLHLSARRLSLCWVVCSQHHCIQIAMLGSKTMSLQG